MKTFLCLLGVLALAACSTVHPYGEPGDASVRTVKELDDNGNVIGSWVVNVQTLHYDSANGDTLSAPGIPHPLHSYEVDSGEAR